MTKNLTCIFTNTDLDERCSFNTANSRAENIFPKSVLENQNKIGTLKTS